MIALALMSTPESSILLSTPESSMFFVIVFFQRTRRMRSMASSKQLQCNMYVFGGICWPRLQVKCVQLHDFETMPFDSMMVWYVLLSELLYSILFY